MQKKKPYPVGKKALCLIRELREVNLYSDDKIACALTDAGYKTMTGLAHWNVSTVWRIREENRIL